MPDRSVVIRNVKKSERWIPLSSQDIEFDMCTEMRRATVDLIRGDPPSNLLGILMVAHGPIRIDDVAEQLDKPVEKVEWIIDQLAEEDLCERITKDGVSLVFGFAAFSSRNAFK
jgi:hypothetical protein